MFAQQVQTSEQANAQAASGTNAASGQGSAPAQARASQGLSPLMEFVAYEARRQVRLGKREFRVQLNPEHLGSVELEVVLEGNELIVRMKAASETAQQVLEENIEQLARSLAEQGMTLDVEIPWRAEKRHEALSPSVAGGPGLQATAAQK
jgi:flagellar hook-length control protein FliK